MSTRIAVDIGGTFTDIVTVDSDDGSIRVSKVMSTPRDLIDGIESGLRLSEVALDDVSDVVHGSTVVINALIERKGARTALITTAGFRDIYEIGRVNRPDAFNLGFEKHRPLIPRSSVFELHERLRADGSVHTAFDVKDARALARQISDEGYDAVAVVFLHSYRNPDHELQMGRVLSQVAPQLYVSLSHELTREYREYERTSTTAANAFVGPAVSEYLARLSARLDEFGGAGALAIMQSNGGLSDVATIRREAVQMMESGPAGGVVGTIELCRQIGHRDAIAFDMGGTTAKASVIKDLQFPAAAEYFVGGYVRGLPIRIPCLDIVEVGTGGGSIAELDSARGLHVGPRSAGADPGPACYGRGGKQPTVTDAAVVLGVLAPDGRLAGGMALDFQAANHAVCSIGDALGMEPAAIASGILAIAASSMANAVRAVTTERGLDPREFALFAYGGNGPLHISLVARELGITRVVVPREPAVFSALGMLMADVRRDVVLTEVRRLDAITAELLDADLAALQVTAQRDAEATGIAYQVVRFLRGADMRYVGQEHSLTVPLPEENLDLRAVKSLFDKAHGERFGHSAPEQPAEIVSLRVSAVGEIERPQLPPIDSGDSAPPLRSITGSRAVIFDHLHAAQTCVVYWRAALRSGNRIVGPAAIEEDTTTTLLRPGDRLEVDEMGNLLITIGQAR